MGVGDEEVSRKIRDYHCSCNRTQNRAALNSVFRFAHEQCARKRMLFFSSAKLIGLLGTGRGGRGALVHI